MRLFQLAPVPQPRRESPPRSKSQDRRRGTSQYSQENALAYFRERELDRELDRRIERDSP